MRPMDVIKSSVWRRVFFGPTKFALAMALAAAAAIFQSGFGLESPARAAETSPHLFTNPLCEQADPWVIRDGDRHIARFADGNRGRKGGTWKEIKHLPSDHQ